jgi:cytochrome c oxidase subunit IV
MRTRSISLSMTLGTGAALIALWAASWALSYTALGSWSLAVALGIAALKAILVALLFMELLVEKASFNLALVTAVTLMGILIAFAVGDVVTRGAAPLEQPPATHPHAEETP